MIRIVIVVFAWMLLLSMPLSFSQETKPPEDEGQETGTSRVRQGEQRVRERLQSAEGREKVFLLNKLSSYYAVRDLGESRECARQALLLAREIGYRKGEILALSNHGVIRTISGDYDRALEHFLDALRIAEEIELKDISGFYNNVGGCLIELGEFDEALEYFEKGLAGARPENKAVRAHALGNMGEVVRKTGDLDRAIELLEEAEDLYKEIENLQELAGVYYSMGNVYLDRGESELAIDYFEKSKIASQRTRYLEGIIYSLSGLSSVYLDVGDHTGALASAIGALTHANEMGSIVLMAMRTGIWPPSMKRWGTGRRPTSIR